jgi:hypothetical protein
VSPEIKPEEKTLRRAIRFCSNEAENWVLDGLACYLHNEGYALSGNKEESDEMWLARIILKDRVQRHADNWEQATAIEREEALHLARIAIRNLPALCDRISHRYVNASKAIRSMEEISRAKMKRAKGRT